MIRRAARATLFPYATLFRPLGVAADRVQAAQTLEIAGELAVPMRDVGGVEQMLGPDIVDGLGEQRLLRFEADPDVRFAEDLARLLFQERHLDIAAQLPMLVD